MGNHYWKLITDNGDMKHTRKSEKLITVTEAE